MKKIYIKDDIKDTVKINCKGKRTVGKADKGIHVKKRIIVGIKN